LLGFYTLLTSQGKITEEFALEIANIRNATNIPRSHRISNSKIGNMLEVELTHMERAPSAASLRTLKLSL
jgi:hypothetical protein